MKSNEDRLVMVVLTETQYAGLSDIFRKAKIIVEQAPLATEILDALIRTAKVMDHVSETTEEMIESLGQFHSFQGHAMTPSSNDENEEKE